MRYTKIERAAITRALNIISEKGPDEERAALTSPAQSARHLRLSLERYDTAREHFLVCFLNAQHHHIATECLFSGTVDGSAIYPREIARRALELGAVAIILAHNHPSGTLTPSAADRRITGRIKDAMALLDVRVLDHVILGPGLGSLSFAEEGIL